MFNPLEVVSRGSETQLDKLYANGKTTFDLRKKLFKHGDKGSDTGVHLEKTHNHDNGNTFT